MFFVTDMPAIWSALLSFAICSPCTFPIRWRVIRADGKRSRYEESGTQTGKFSYVILEKECIRHSHGHVTCDLCTAFKGIQRIAVSRRTGILYQRARTRRDGELFPLQMKTVSTQNMFDLCDHIDPKKICRIRFIYNKFL
ncbi:hypothetical protein COOONC_11740 [Cooperia oncophora]